MVWVIFFIPFAVWLSFSLVSQFNPASLAIVSMVILIFSLVELSQILKDRSRSKAPFMIMCLILVSLLGGVIFR
jgi:hypothetical protein